MFGMRAIYMGHLINNAQGGKTVEWTIVVSTRRTSDIHPAIFVFDYMGVNYLHVGHLQYTPPVLLREKYTHKKKIISEFECTKMHTLHYFIESCVNL
jgi:hypothetical protein